MEGVNVSTHPEVPGSISMDNDMTFDKLIEVIHFLWEFLAMMALTRDGQLDQNLAQDVKRNVLEYHSMKKERRGRTWKDSPMGFIHLLMLECCGICTVLREVDCKPVQSVPRVFV
ncbi:hypothetical protein HAX54_053283 [Datura stramonium]|uniref:Uncharacterized protein n=1 Tax=Datura stramonium TaxID=4076 RepID=A0ABS8T2D9_DATST|nr:hypothetical protein [Datura stramonium]